MPKIASCCENSAKFQVVNWWQVSHVCEKPSAACDGLVVAAKVAWWHATHGVTGPLNCWKAAWRWQSTHFRAACTPSSGSRVRAWASRASTCCQLDS